jgi:hypothetical protein
MAKDSLERFIEAVRSAWGPLSSGLAAECRQRLGELAMAPATEAWLAPLLQDPPGNQELYRDPEHGFMLLVHDAEAGQYRLPHDHGHGWVVYAVQHGEMEMGTFARVEDPGGAPRLVKRDATRMRAGDCRIYLPGDIHDTTCVSGDALIFRFTSCDLAVEEREGRLTRYP